MSWFGFDLKIVKCCRTSHNSLFPFLSLFLSDSHTHTPFPTLTEKLTEFPDELEGKGAQLTSHDARGSCESAAGKPGEDADNGKQDAKETSQKGGEGATETERGEREERVGTGEAVSIAGWAASPPARTPARPGHQNSAAPVGLFCRRSGRAGEGQCICPWPLASIRLETSASAVVNSGLSSPPPWGAPLCKSHAKTTATLPPLSAIKLPRNVPHHKVLEPSVLDLRKDIVSWSQASLQKLRPREVGQGRTSCREQSLLSLSTPTLPSTLQLILVHHTFGSCFRGILSSPLHLCVLPFYELHLIQCLPSIPL